MKVHALLFVLAISLSELAWVAADVDDHDDKWLPAELQSDAVVNVSSAKLDGRCTFNTLHSHATCHYDTNGEWLPPLELHINGQNTTNSSTGYMRLTMLDDFKGVNGEGGLALHRLAIVWHCSALRSVHATLPFKLSVVSSTLCEGEGGCSVSSCNRLQRSDAVPAVDPSANEQPGESHCQLLEGVDYCSASDGEKGGSGGNACLYHRIHVAPPEKCPTEAHLIFECLTPWEPKVEMDRLFWNSATIQTAPRQAAGVGEKLFISEHEQQPGLFLSSFDTHTGLNALGARVERIASAPDGHHSRATNPLEDSEGDEEWWAQMGPPSPLIIHNQRLKAGLVLEGPGHEALRRMQLCPAASMRNWKDNALNPADCRINASAMCPQCVPVLDPNSGRHSVHCTCHEPFLLEDIDRRLEAGEGRKVGILGLANDEDDEFMLRPTNPELVFPAPVGSAGTAQCWAVTVRTSATNLTIDYQQGVLGTVFYFFHGGLLTNLIAILLITVPIAALATFLCSAYYHADEEEHLHND